MSAEDVQKNAAKALEASGDVDASATTSSSDGKRRLEISSAGSDVTSDGASSGERQPAKKRSKILGDLNLNDAEVQRLLNTKSKHAAALAMIALSTVSQWTHHPARTRSIGTYLNTQKRPGPTDLVPGTVVLCCAGSHLIAPCVRLESRSYKCFRSGQSRQLQRASSFLTALLQWNLRFQPTAF